MKTLFLCLCMALFMGCSAPTKPVSKDTPVTKCKCDPCGCKDCQCEGCCKCESCKPCVKKKCCEDK